jgi:cell wall-associated NlpC family hydrolase
MFVTSLHIRRTVLFVILMTVALVSAYTVDTKEADAATYYERQALSGVAHSYIGTPYGYGYYGLTCSVLTQRVYAEALGRYIPGDPYGQLLSGYPVYNLQRGDLVFYDSYLDGGIDHVAIYVGGGQVIDANAYWGTTLKHGVHDIPGYVTARRIT